MNATTSSGVKFYGKMEAYSFEKHTVWQVGVEGSSKKFAIHFSPRKHYQDGAYSSAAWVIEEIVEGVEPFTSFRQKTFKHHTCKNVPAKMIAWIKKQG